ncbi:TPA: ImmA/IrrE family metallo-endopeptidase [Bacillus thuringiensis]|uniref:IrrE N-terminal-like domain-containing protein n=4 Tax=Bacillus cereus group TaxID=86661 RepID=A0A9X6KR58_BACTU|nr:MULTISPECIES: ImmA/IrrE family metallo-endopeptidase [Bacillus cereus group]AEA19521.1 hypothetical protein CT43_P281179 [Bacillus thuringiensis serovar chinensis CT-43]AGG05223.1 hypothetical protein H175_285p185 [Bacillus thuringiensis serovar thuringiensis str. IS5056]AHZ54902.1 hypothetical protein YBT1520_32021 [Bacillus thuringiensis serovar kurstaki str. YBT-1520]AIE37350.1 hypothetical protein BTK_32071 [Bacillus thuringiensis serovar kurstaki str. HD-1]AIM34636.1 hypothetical prote
MINSTNIREVIEQNQKILPSILVNVESTIEKGIHFKYKTIESIRNYLMQKTEVLLFPSKSLSYGGMVLYRNGSFYININTLQPKTYENFVWAHEYYHFEFEKDRIKNADDVTFVNNPVLNENERRANLFAAELLINDDVLKTLFQEIKLNYVNDSLEKNVIRLIPAFELPYKTMVIKLAQENLISMEDAERIIDHDYRHNLPQDFDLSILEPTKAIKIDGLNKLLESESVQENMLESDFESIQNLANQHFKQLEAIRMEI